MKIAGIKLTSFGHFTDHSLQFGDASLILLSGPNESGKSTVLRGIRESLFGFTRHSFSKTGEIRTEIDCDLKDGRRVHFARRRVNKKNLFESATLSGSTSFDEENWNAMLGGIDLETYTSLFGFGLVDLAAGESSLKGGNLTEALLGSGQAKSIDWKTVRGGLDKSKGQLLTPKGRNQEIPTLLKNLRDLQTQTDAKTVRPRVLRDLKGTSRELNQQSEALQLERAKLHQELRHCERGLEAWAIAKQYVIKKNEQSQETYPEWMTAEWATKWLAIQSSIESRDRELATMIRELQGVKSELAGIPEDTVSADANDSLQRMSGQIGPQQEALQRIMQIDTELQTMRIEEARLLNDLSLGGEASKIASLPIGLSRKARLDEISEPLELAKRECLSLENERAKLRSELEQNRTRLLELSITQTQDEAAIAFESLTRHVGQWQHALQAHDEFEEQAKEYQFLLSKLSPLFGEGISGSGDWIGRIQLPSVEDLEAHQKLEERWDLQRLELIREIQQLERSKEDLLSLIRELNQQGTLPTRSQLETLRRERDHWMKSLGTAPSRVEPSRPLFQDDDSFEELPEESEALEDATSSVGSGTASNVLKKVKRRTSGNSSQKRLMQIHSEMDSLVDAMLRDSQRIAKWEQAVAQSESIDQSLRLLRGQLDELQVECNRHRALLQKMLSGFSIEPTELNLLKQSLREMKQLQTLSIKTQTLEERKSGLAMKLEEKLRAFSATFLSVDSPMPSPSDLESSWDWVRRRWSEVQKQSGQAEAILEGNKRLEKELLDLERQKCEWESQAIRLQSAFDAWLQQLGLPEGTSPKLAEQLVHTISDYKQIRSEIGRLEFERSGHQSRHDEFRDSANQMLMQLGMNTSDSSWHEFVQKIELGRHQAELAANDKRRRELLWVRSEEKTMAYETLHNEWQSMIGERKKLAEIAGGIDPVKLQEFAHRARGYWEEKNQLKSLREQLILLAPNDQDIEGWIEALTRSDLGTMESKRDQLQQKIDQIEMKTKELARELGSIDQEWKNLQREDPVTELALERQNLLARLENSAERWMVLAVAEIMLDLAMKRFHGSQEQTIARDVVELFQRLTGGKYVDVTEDPKDGHRFQVLDAKGDAKHPDQLSTGTREQLYLAIRLAHIRHYCQVNEPLPLVMDDCFVNFDDVRLRATLETVFEQSRSQQVILLSCHERTEAIFREVAPDSLVLSLK